ncbi:Co-chaperone Hsc20 [Agrocybe pediades]|nr:Co-chaperone Hsc20 [Agrocybe pediades]
MLSLLPSLQRTLAHSPRPAIVSPLLSRQRRFQSTVAKCPSCSAPLPSNLPACKSCWSIYPLPPKTTHHQLLDVPYDPNPFIVDPKALKSHFQRAQAVCHPDSWASKSPKYTDLAHTLSSRVNEAYRCLLDPLTRAEYILELNGLKMSETDQVDDMEFMAEIMEAREAIDDAEPTDKATIHELQEQNQEHIRQTLKELEGLIGRHEWKEVKGAAIKLRYLRGIDRAIINWLSVHSN